MNNENTRAAEDDARSTRDELEARRGKVLTLRLRRMTQAQIATALGVDQATISRDLAWIAQHWKERFGTPATLDPTQEIGEAIALFADVEVAALRAFTKLMAGEARACNAYLRTAMIARQMRIDLLQELGFIDRQIGAVSMVFRADAVRQALREEGLLPTDGRAIDAEVTPADDEVEQWLRQAGRRAHSVGSRSYPEGSVEGMQTEQERNETVTP